MPLTDATRKLFSLPPWLKVEDSNEQFTLSFPRASRENPSLLDLNFDIIITINQIYQQVNVEPPNLTIVLDGTDQTFRTFIQVPPYSARCYLQRYNNLGSIETIFTGSLWQIQISENITLTMVY